MGYWLLVNVSMNRNDYDILSFPSISLDFSLSVIPPFLDGFHGAQAWTSTNVRVLQ
jgi:hypothetical protein